MPVRPAPAGHAPFAADAHLPGLLDGLDPSLARARLGERIERLSERRVECLHCSVERVRYRPGERAIILYHLHLRDRASGFEARTWATGTLLRGDRAGHVTDADQYDSVGHGGLPEMFLEPATGMTVEMFPRDRRLPELRTLLQARDGRLDSLMGGAPSTGTWQVEAVRYRPTLGATLRIVGGTRSGFSRLERARDPATRHAEATRLHAALDGSAIGAPMPLGFSEALRSVATAAAPGHSLSELLAHPGRVDVAVVARLIAQALLALHASTYRAAQSTATVELLDTMRAGAAQLRHACPDEADTVDSLLAALAELPGGFEPAPVHMDLKPDDLFIDGARVTLTASDAMVMADPALDVAMLHARLRAMPFTHGVSAQRAGLAATVFEDEYLAHASREFAARLPLARAWAALRVARYWLLHLVDDWPRRIAETLQRARSELGDAPLPLLDRMRRVWLPGNPAPRDRRGP